MSDKVWVIVLPLVNLDIRYVEYSSIARTMNGVFLTGEGKCPEISPSIWSETESIKNFVIAQLAIEVENQQRKLDKAQAALESVWNLSTMDFGEKYG